MFGRENDALHPGVFTGAGPLSCIQMRGIEKLRIFITKSPLLIGVGIEGIMQKGIGLELVPFQLIRIGNRAAGSGNRHRFLSACTKTERQCREKHCK